MNFDDPRIAALWDQFNTLLILLERPVVQRQLWVFALLLLVSWLLPTVAQMLNLRPQAYVARTAWQRRMWRRVRNIRYIYFPLLGILLGQFVIRFFLSQDWRAGLIERLLPIFWFLLIYRILIALFYAFFDEDGARAYQRYFILPVFIIFVLINLNFNFAGAFSLGQVPLLSFQDTQLTVGALFQATVVLYLFFAVAWLTSDILERLVFPRITADAGLSNAIGVIVYYTVVVIGFLSAAGALGINLSSLAIIGGGLTVGIGFGLQDLVNNFISGILLLFERTLRPGDVVEVNGQRGEVKQLRMRSTMLRTLDNTEIVVPNKNFLNSSISNYTQTDRVVRQLVNVGVSYNSDPTEVRDILLAVAERHGRVLNKPEPSVQFANFGESSLDFQLLIFIDDPMAANRITSDLRFMIWNEFAKHSIEIPFPQRDLHVRSGLPEFVETRAVQEASVPEEKEAVEPDTLTR
ncbi:MAG: mechanosensitive ion channel [Caldilineaceae bacterium]